ncbi:calcium-binding protein [Aestuariivita sp.]|jgi:Ca2+-binding RTX toxin-like protein|uniref:calcium-binding protein n=1 Tax=Aestuariivita sp. TaxID=1872407 RepID=UPI00216CBD7E|nr:calcium-binding protein [Aestuariivita sp.]MCE8009900.1 calcium-binding protein [Aestuariivita sp.]
MPDTLYFRETAPLTTTEVTSFLYDTLALPSGAVARLFYTDDGPVLRVGESETLLPAPEGTVGAPAFFHDPRFVVAPNGRVAITYEVTTPEDPVTFDFDFALAAVGLTEAGALASAPVILSQDDGAYFWNNPVHFNGGGFAYVTYESVYDETGGYMGDIAHITRVTADGTPFPELDFPEDPNLIVTSMQALPGGRLAVIWESFITEGPERFQIYEADGSTLSPPQVVPDMSLVYGYSTELELLVLADGTLAALWLDRSDELAPVLKFSLVNADGTLGPAQSLTTFEGDDIGFGEWRDVQAFDDGSFGVLFDVYTTNLTTYYQRFDADGTALGDPVKVVDIPPDTILWVVVAELLPGGGFAVLIEQGNPDDFSAFWSLQFFAPDGAALGPAQPVPELPAVDGFVYNVVLLVQPDGSVTVDWLADIAEDTGFVQTANQLTVSPVSFRALTEGDDTETLATPDAVDGLAGDDAITGSDGIDRLLGGAGDDALAGGAGDDFLSGGTGTNTLEGGDGTDAAYFADVFDAFDFTFDRETGAITVTGTDSTDTLTGIERFDFTDLSLGTDELLLLGGFYDDMFAGSEADDAFAGGLGDDTIRGLGGDDQLDGGVGRDRINGGDGDDTLIGGPEDNDSRDRIFGGTGDDDIRGGAGNDLLYGQEGNDLIIGGRGADDLFGQTGDDVISGGSYSDLIFGGDGDDFLNGGFGHDAVNGGAGTDIFFHAGMRGHGTDWIQDYDDTEGDILLFGDTGAVAGEFRIRMAHAESSLADRPGDDDVAEAFIVHQPTGQIAWVLVDGAALDEIWLKIPDGGGTYDLMDMI